MATVVFSTYNFRLEERDHKKLIFDIVRKKWVSLTPEEWVRQHIIHYLVFDKQYPVGLIAVERGIDLNGTQKRFDIVVFNTSGTPKMIIECKAPEEPLNQKVFEQITRYNISLRVDYLWVTNGTYNYACKLKTNVEPIDTIPAWETLNAN